MTVSKHSYNYYLDKLLNIINKQYSDKTLFDILNKNIVYENQNKTINLSDVVKLKLKEQIDNDFIDNVFKINNITLISFLYNTNGFWDILKEKEIVDYAIQKLEKHTNIVNTNKDIYIKTICYSILLNYNIFTFKQFKDLVKFIEIPSTILDKMFEDDFGREVMFELVENKSLNNIFENLRKDNNNKLMLSVVNKNYILNNKQYFFRKMSFYNVVQNILSVMINTKNKHSNVLELLNKLTIDNKYYFIIRDYFSNNSAINNIDFDNFFKVDYTNSNNYFYKNNKGVFLSPNPQEHILVTNKNGVYPIGYDKIFKDYLFLDADGYIKPLSTENLELFRKSDSSIGVFLDITKQYVSVSKISDTKYKTK